MTLKRTSFFQLTKRKGELQAKRAARTKPWGCGGVEFLGAHVRDLARMGVQGGRRGWSEARQDQRQRLILAAASESDPKSYEKPLKGL